MSPRTVPPRDACPEWRHASVGAMASKPASAQRVQWTLFETRGDPFAPDDILLGTRSRSQRDLHACSRLDTLFVQRCDEYYAE